MEQAEQHADQKEAPRYTRRMRSKVAESVRKAQLDRMKAMTPAERVALATELGEREIAALMAAANLTRDEARAEIRRSRQAGRKPSAAMDGARGLSPRSDSPATSG